MARPRKPKPKKPFGEYSGVLIRDPDIKPETKFGDDHTVAYFNLDGSDNGHGSRKLVKVDAFKETADALLTFKRGQFIRVRGYVTESAIQRDGLTMSGINITALELGRS